MRINTLGIYNKKNEFYQFTTEENINSQFVIDSVGNKYRVNFT